MAYRASRPQGQSAAPAPVAQRGAGAVGQRQSSLGLGAEGRSVVVPGRPPVEPTAKGRAIREEIEALNEEYFGTPTAQAVAPTSSTAARSALHAALSSQCVRPVALPQMPLASGWSVGPVDVAGKLMDASDRNLLCMDMRGPLVVVGGADHGLSVWNTIKGTRERLLFSKNAGHTEWVTACAFTPSGQIVSGGMDSRLLLWGRAGSACETLTHPTETHRGAISALAVGSNSVAISASYDRTLKLWNTSGRGANSFLGTLSGHTAPVTHLVWQDATIMSGDRKGAVMLWDATTQQCVLSAGTTGGQVGSVGVMRDDEFHLLLAGDQNGTLSIWDVRGDPSRPVARCKLHPGGVVSASLSTSMNSDNFIVTAGADKQMHCIDPRGGFDKPVFTWVDHRDFIYTVESHANIVFSAAGNGWLLAHDVDTGACCYGLGAGQNAMRCIATNDSQLVCAGDDGKVMSYDFR